MREKNEPPMFFQMTAPAWMLFAAARSGYPSALKSPDAMLSGPSPAATTRMAAANSPHAKLDQDFVDAEPEDPACALIVTPGAAGLHLVTLEPLRHQTDHRLAGRLELGRVCFRNAA